MIPRSRPSARLINARLSSHVSSCASRQGTPARLQSSRAEPGSSADAKKAQSNYKIVETVKDFEKTVAKRPDFDNSNKPIEMTKSPNPSWNYGEGVPGVSGKSIGHEEIDPYASDRPMVSNYRLMISGIAPRPIGLLSTLAADGKTKNLSPFSYFQVIDHDPPTFVIGFSSRPGRVKDTYRNLKETGECVINTVSENMIEAINAASIDAPYGVSEWDVSGLTEASTTTVKPARVEESVLSIEGKVIETKEFDDHAKPGMSIASLALVKATRFWVRQDAANAEYSHIDLEKLRPIAQLGGMSYGRVTSTFELPRKRWTDEQPKNELLTRLHGEDSQP